MWTADKVLKRIKSTTLSPLLEMGLSPLFINRLDNEFSQLWALYKELYGNSFDCLYQLEDLIEMIALKTLERPESLNQRDENREKEKNWFIDRRSVGVMLYVDLFNVDLKGLKKKISYFEEMGINTLHLMPLFKSPADESDGGYAVSDYQSVRSDLGTMKELSQLAEIMRNKGMILILDFILNHTSDDHQWAKNALAGDEEFQNYYFMFDSKEEAQSYDTHLRKIFPTVRSGSFTYIEDCGKWAWTTFNSFQWDLNYSNPQLFKAMCSQMLYLSNHGADVLRLDALAFIWKEKGTLCENLPKAHTLIKLFRSAAKIGAPGLSFLSEAIVHPDEVINYITESECELSYNPLLMATGWEALATRNTELLKKTFSPRFHIPQNCRWVNYIRCHDDIGWTFCDEDAASIHINGYDHRRFLNEFYTGRFNGSFAKGVPFQENIETGDARISGTLASLAGLEKALNGNNPIEIDLSVRRIKMLFGFILSLPGLPLIYSGDELAMLNNYNYMKVEKHSDDSRWVHRIPFDWSEVNQRGNENKNKPSSIINNYIKEMIKKRSLLEEIEGTLDLINIQNSNILSYKLSKGHESVIVLINFTERLTIIPLNSLRIYSGSYHFREVISSRIYKDDIHMEPYEILWLKRIEL